MGAHQLLLLPSRVVQLGQLVGTHFRKLRPDTSSSNNHDDFYSATYRPTPTFFFIKLNVFLITFYISTIINITAILISIISIFDTLPTFSFSGFLGSLFCGTPFSQP